MQSDIADLTLVIVLGSAILLALVLFIVVFLFFFRRKQLRNRAEKQQLIETYERELLTSQIEIQEQTLQRVGEDLHDDVGQTLALAWLQLNVLDADAAESVYSPAIRRVIESVRSTIKSVRSLSKSLDNRAVERFGLPDILARELERIEATGRFGTQLIVTGEPYALPDQSETLLFRMAQESLNNALKHARCQTITITLTYRPEQFQMMIGDDGIGFSDADVAGRPLAGSGSGLTNLRRRAALLGGSCSIGPGYPAGTQVVITLPQKVAG